MGLLVLVLVIVWAVLNYKGIKDNVELKLWDGKQDQSAVDWSKEPNRLEISKTNTIGRIIFPKNLDELNKSLDAGINHYPESAQIGEWGNTVLTAHSSSLRRSYYQSIFSTLNNLEKGDEVIAYKDFAKYRYVIKEKKIISPDDVSYINSKREKENLVLITCWPLGTNLKRLTVVAERVY